MFIDIGFSEILDVAIMSFLIYIVLMWFKKSRAAFVLTGIIIIAAVYLLAQQFNLVLTTWVFQGFFAVILLASVVIFQEEIRRFFEQVAVWSLNPRLRKHKTTLPRTEIEILVRTLTDLAHDKIGALIVLKGKNLIMGHLDAGVDLNGQLSEPMLKSIFDPHSIGHDGAVVIDGNKIIQFGAHLPLSKNLKQMEHGGTRHAAALGLSEMTDALCLVVSEEKGTISAARHGKMHSLKDFESLWHIIENFYREMIPPAEKRTWKNYILKNFKEKVTAIALAVMLWFVQVYGSTVIYKTFTIPVEYAEAEAKLEIIATEPKEVDITFSGPRRDLYFLRKGKIRLFLKTLDLKKGTRTIKISASDLSYPQNIALENIDPSRVTVKVKEIKEEQEEEKEERKL